MSTRLAEDADEPAPVMPPAGPAAEPPLPLSARAADYLVMALAVILGGGSLVLLVWPARPTLVEIPSSPRAALAWNAALSSLFFAQHSILVRRGVRARLAVVVPERYDAAFYAISSGAVLALVALLQQPTGPPLFVLHGLPRLIVHAAALFAFAAFVWGIVALRSFDPFGLRPIRRRLRGRSAASGPKAFVVRGPYRWVRHPLYTSVIVMLWANPGPSAGEIGLASLWSAWIVVGTLLEERDLVSDLGDTYRSYRRRVPMLVPWRAPIEPQEVRHA